MKILILSDIHGDYESLRKVIDNESFDKLIILGDLFSYGCSSFSLKSEKIIEILKQNKDKLILIKGNCDSYIDYDKFKLFSHDIITIPLNNHHVTLTHGNIYSKGFLPNYHGDIIMTGHTHIPMLTKEQGIIYANPGSIGNPRGMSERSYIIFDTNKLTLKNIDKITIKKMEI